MQLFETLFNYYPTGEVTPQDFIDTLAIGSDGWLSTWGTVTLTVIFGMLVYIIPIIITEKEKVGPYPLWLHTFYCAADFMGIWVFLSAWLEYDHFPVFLALSVGEAIWVGMEIFCLQRTIAYESDLYWAKSTPLGHKLRDICLQILLFFVGLNLLRAELIDPTMWKFWIFTQILITTVPAIVLMQRKTRNGSSRSLHLTLICVALISFNPWWNMWLAIAPDYFSLSANPWYYITGFVCLCVACYGLYYYEQLPKKENTNLFTK